MRATLWGTRGSLAAPGAETSRYGGNTSCVEVRGDGGTVVVLDAGTGVRRLGSTLAGQTRCIHLLLTHLHMDHIQGLGFFAPLYDPGVEVHVWGPTSPTAGLRQRLMRYLSPPLFPVHMRDLPCTIHLHEAPYGTFTAGEFDVACTLVCHPGPTLGYRIRGERGIVAYLPDHEPALGVRDFPQSPEWTSGCDIAADANLLIHDAQYTVDEYPSHVGWGHSSLEQTLRFASLARVKRLVPFHHDPGHDDAQIDRMLAEARQSQWPFELAAGREGASFEIGAAE
jgi:phosphoribosyl 1,2-cyclic phosphodiesterase